MFTWICDCLHILLTCIRPQTRSSAFLGFFLLWFCLNDVQLQSKLLDCVCHWLAICFPFLNRVTAPILKPTYDQKLEILGGLKERYIHWLIHAYKFSIICLYSPHFGPCPPPCLRLWIHVWGTALVFFNPFPRQNILKLIFESFITIMCSRFKKSTKIFTGLCKLENLTKHYFSFFLKDKGISDRINSQDDWYFIQLHTITTLQILLFSSIWWSGKYPCCTFPLRFATKNYYLG